MIISGKLLIIIVLSVAIGISAANIAVFGMGVYFVKASLEKSEIHYGDTAKIFVQIQTYEPHTVYGLKIKTFFVDSDAQDFFEIQNSEINIGYLTKKYNLSKEIPIRITAINPTDTEKKFKIFVTSIMNEKETDRKMFELTLLPNS
jgi:hypothetical protein